MSCAVSVVMPVYNQAARLGAAIDSVRAQRLADWELLIVDDGSTGEAARSWSAMRHSTRDASGCSRIRTGRGAAASRNRGIAEARGRYLAFLDSDDLFLRDKFAEEVVRLDAHPEAAMMYGPALWRRQDGRRADRVDRIGIEVGRVHRPPDLVRRVLVERHGNVPCTCAVLIRRDIAVELGGPSGSTRNRRCGPRCS